METDWLGLAGKVCVVTGGASGIGEAITEGFLAAGAKVAILDIALATGGAALPGEGSLLRITCDTSREENVDAAAQTVRTAFGRCDVLVNNAAVFRPKALVDTTLDDWNTGLAINLTGYFNCARAFGRLMIEANGGSMVHIGSIAAFVGQHLGIDYSASKSAITALSRQIAIEWGGYGIRSNVVHPGLTKTPLTAARNAGSDVLEHRARMTATKRMGEPQDIADAVMFLASDRSSYVTGADLAVDGGIQKMLTELIPNATRKSDFEQGLRK